MDAPGEPRALGLFGWPQLRRGLVRNFHGSLRAGPRSVDDRVPRDRVEPGSSGAALGPVAGRRAPDRRERLLRRVLGTAAITETTQREREDWTNKAAVEHVEGVAVAAGDPLQQIAVGAVLGCGGLPFARDRTGGKIESELHVLVSTCAHVDLDCSRRPPSTTSEAPVTKLAPVRKTTASATSSGLPTRPSSVSVARRSSCSGATATGPGAIPQTRTSGASARANTRVNIACAALAAE